MGLHQANFTVWGLKLGSCLCLSGGAYAARQAWSCGANAKCVELECELVEWLAGEDRDWSFVVLCITVWQSCHTVYEACSKKDRTFAIKTLLLILQHFKHCPLQSSPLCCRYTIPNVSSIVVMLLGTHFVRWCAVLLLHFPEPPLCHLSNEQLVHVLSSADVARRLMLIAKRNKWQFVVKTWR
jgi:hypothetical protein